MVSPRLSVVVPFHDVEDYIGACLESLRRQTLTELEVVLVDDGSTDASRELAEEYVARDSRFRIVTQTNQGLGPARNTGAADATGRHLTFVDSDDVIPLHAYDALVGSLESSGSDFAAGDARRFNVHGTTPSYVHQQVFTETLVGTRIDRTPRLALDRMAWNKVYRRGFWTDTGLTFPAMLYEDYPVSIRAHLSARAVDVLAEPVYFWRQRDSGGPSITQRHAELANLEQRVRSAELALDELGTAVPAATRLMQQHLLQIDVPTLVSALLVHPPEERPAIVELAQRLTRRMPSPATLDLPPYHRVVATLAAEGRLPELVRLAEHRRDVGAAAPVVRLPLRPRRQFAALPYWRERDHGLDTADFELRGETVALRPVVEDTFWDGADLVVDLVLDAGELALGDRPDVGIALVSRDGSRRLTPRSELRDVVRPFLGTDRAGVRVRLAAGELPPPGDARALFWHWEVRLKVPGLETTVAVTRVANTRARAAAARHRDDLLLQPCQLRGEFGVWVRGAEPAWLDEVDVADGDLVLTGGYRPGAQVGLRLDGPDRSLDLAVEVFPERAGWRARVPARHLVALPSYDDPTGQERRWTARLVVDDEPLVIRVMDRFRTVGVRVDEREVTATVNGRGMLMFTDTNLAPRVLAVRWSSATELELCFAWRGTQPIGGRVLVQHALADGTVIEASGPVRRTRDDWSAVVDVAGLVDLRQRHPAPPSGTPADRWHLLVQTPQRLSTLVAGRTEMSTYPAPQLVGDVVVTVLVGRADVVGLQLAPRP